MFLALILSATFNGQNLPPVTDRSVMISLAPSPDHGCEIRGPDGMMIDRNALVERAGEWVGRQVRIVVGDAPYRCIGGAIFALQQAGVADIETIPQWSTHILRVPAGECRVMLDYREMPIGSLPQALRAFGTTNPQIEVRPDPAADFDCLDQVLQAMRSAGVPMRLGFVGNAAVVEGERSK